MLGGLGPKTPSGPFPPLGWAKSPSLWLFFIEAFPYSHLVILGHFVHVVTLPVYILIFDILNLAKGRVKKKILVKYCTKINYFHEWGAQRIFF